MASLADVATLSLSYVDKYSRRSGGFLVEAQDVVDIALEVKQVAPRSGCSFPRKCRVDDIGKDEQ